MDNENKSYFYSTSEELAVCALTVAIALAKGKTHKEIKTIRNFLLLIVNNLTVIDDQRGLYDENFINTGNNRNTVNDVNTSNNGSNNNSK